MRALQSEGDSARRFVWIETVVCVVLVVLTWWLVLGDLGSSTFHDGDEALFATVSRTMGDTGEWTTPKFWNEPFLHKAPLMFWLMAASYAVVPGSFEFQARFPSALAGILLLGGVYLVGRRLGGVAVGAGAVLLLLSNHQFLFEHSIRSASLDSGLGTLMFAALALGASAYKSRSALVVSAACLALVLMVKAPMVIFVVPTVFFHLRAQERRAAFRWLAWCVGCGAILALPWHIHAFSVHGREFWDTYVGYEILGRLGSAAKDPESTPWIHVDALWRGFLPWSPLIVLATVAGLIGWPGRDASGRAVRRLFAAYAVFLLGFFCLLPSKWPWYGLPACPVLAVLGALFLKDVLASRYRGVLPIGLALLLVARWLLLHPDPQYSPVSRSTWLWPGHTRLYDVFWESAGLLTWTLIGVVVVITAIPLVRRFSHVAAATTIVSLVLAGLLFATSLVTIVQIPRDYECATRKLVRTLEERGIERLLTLGFPRRPMYANRQTPITSVYFLGLEGAEVVDCFDRFDCLDLPADGRTALTVYAPAMGPRGRAALTRALRKLSDPPEVWVLDPNSTDRFERFFWR